MAIQTVAYPYHGILVSNEKEQIINTYHSLDRSQRNCVCQVNTSVLKSHVLCDPFTSYSQNVKIAEIESRLVIAIG